MAADKIDLADAEYPVWIGGAEAVLSAAMGITDGGLYEAGFTPIGHLLTPVTMKHTASHACAYEPRSDEQTLHYHA